MFEKLKGLVGGMGARGAVATDAPDELPRMQFAAIAAKVGMPEEKVAMMAQMVRQSGMADAQMGFMMQTATAKGVTCEEIMSMLTSMGVAKSQVVRVMSAQGLMAEDEARRILDAERAAAERRAAASKTSARKRFGWWCGNCWTTWSTTALCLPGLSARLRRWPTRWSCRTSG